jgi:Holliday junction resolvase
MKLTNKQMSVEHENFIALAMSGKRERASGASITAPGDVITDDYLVECKVSETGRVSISADAIAKIREEAATRGRRPMIALRLRDPYGGKHIDMVVKLLDDELEDRVYAS